MVGRLAESLPLVGGHVCADEIRDWEKTMLWTIIVILAVLWMLGLIGNVGGGLIHLLLVAAVIVLVFSLLTGRRPTV
jgi:hypothetical protein